MSVITRWRSPPQAAGGIEVGDFKYSVLKARTGIRLAQIQPGSGNRAIAITLIDSFVTGTGRVPYDALSYTWGEGTRSKYIFCNGRRLPVTRTLWEALNRFRDAVEEITLWIDQICICQDRVKERNAQVQMMGDIFKAARKVIVWLGDDYDDSRAGMQLAQQLLNIAQYRPVSGLTPSDLETHGLPRYGHRRWKALALILRRPWFWRTWIIQEVVLNPNVELVLGSSSLTWDELESIVALLEGPLPRVWQMDQAVTASELPFSRINRIRLRHQRQIVTPTSPTQMILPQAGQLYEEPTQTVDDNDDDPDLLDLLMMSRDLGATDPRDKIYALLGLGKHNIDPDYSMSPESVFTEFAMDAIGLVTAMTARQAHLGFPLTAQDREVRRAMILLSCAGRQNQKLKLPSWVVDWTTNLQSRPLIFGVGQSFSAGGDELGIFDWQPDFGLQLSGKLFDTVHAAGRVNLDYQGDDYPPSSHKLIESWWKEARDIAYRRTIRSPGTTGHTDAFENLRRDLLLCRHGYYVADEGGRSKRRSSLLDETDIAAFTSVHSAQRTLTLGPTRGRVLFVSGSGYVGLAPHGTLEGDVIFVVLGADVPFILRQTGGTGSYHLVGEAYVQGIMHGEALGMNTMFGVQDIMIR